MAGIRIRDGKLQVYVRPPKYQGEVRVKAEWRDCQFGCFWCVYIAHYANQGRI